MIKKICFFTPEYDPARQSQMNYYEKVLPKKIEIFVVSLKEVDKKYNLKRSKIFSLGYDKIKAPFRLRKFCRENEIDLLTNLRGTGRALFGFVIATVFTKTKTLFYVVGNPKFGSSLNWPYFISQFFIDRFLSSSKWVTENMKNFLFFSRNKIFYLTNPVDINKFKPKTNTELRKKIGFKEKDKILIYVGRIEPEQGSDYLLELIQENPDKKFLLIGSMRDENYKNAKFKNMIHIPFIQNTDLPDYYNISDLCLFFTKRNAYPLPPREALSCGIPAMVFDLNTFEQLSTNSAIKVPFDLDIIQKEIDKFFKLSKKERKRLSKEARDFIIKDCSEEAVEKDTLKRFLEI